MENKKNKRADLSKRSVLFFQIGLILALFLAWQLIEWKVDGREISQKGYVSVEGFEEIDAPLTRVEEVKPPEPPKVNFKEIEVIDDDLNKVETVVASTEATDEPILEVADIKIAEDVEDIQDYNMLSVEEVPVFPGCETESGNEARRQCMSEEVNRIVGRTFNSQLGDELGLSGLHRIYVSFKIQPDGTVAIIGARGPHPKLEAEAIRVVKTFPDMIPGKQGGIPVGVTYTLPITLRIQN